MTVSELIAFLQTQPQDIQVAYCCYSEQLLLKVDEIELKRGCPPRPDRWVHDERPDVESQEYLLLPGN